MLFSAALWASLLLPVSAHALEPLQKPWDTGSILHGFKSLWGGQVLVITAESALDTGKATQGQLRFYAALERARTTVDNFITTNGCSADRTQRVYENIYRITANKTPLRP